MHEISIRFARKFLNFFYSLDINIHNDLPMFGPYYAAHRNYSPEEGKPYIQCNSTHWLIKMYLPDVDPNDLSVTLDEQTHKLHLEWTDCKKLRHQGRLYESRESHNTALDVPNSIHNEDVNVQWDGKTVTIALPKPVPKKECQALALQSGGALMRIPLPPDSNHSVDIQVKGNQLIVSVEVEATHSDGSSSYSRTMRSVRVPDGVNTSDVETLVEDDHVVIALKKKPIDENQPEEHPEEVEQPEQIASDVPLPVD